jgi:ferrous-iron efflux pump FieF
MHRFGHGKAEALAGFIQSIVIFLSGIYLIYESTKRFMKPADITNIKLGVVVMGVSILFTLLLVSYQHKVQKQGKSMVVAADRLHYVTDLLTNVVVVISLGLQHFFSLNYFDAVAALGIAVFIMSSSLKIFKQSFDILMDKDISDKYREDLKQVIDKISDDVIGYHDLRSRSGGDIDFLEFHLEIPSSISVIKSHELVEKIMYSLKNIHPNLEIIVHTDPAEVDKKSGKIKLFDREKPRFY